MKLSDCLKRIDILPDDAARIRALQKDYLADGMTPEQAAVNAVETVIAEVEAERTQLLDRITREGGDVTEYFQAQVPDAVAQYRREQEARPIKGEIKEPLVNKDGRYRRNAKGDITGAPEGVKTKAHINKIVRENIGHMEDPLAQMPDSAEWYEVSGRAIRDITLGDPQKMENMVRMMAVLSAANQVGGNVTAAIQAMHQLAAGETLIAGRRPNVFREWVPDILAAEDISFDVPGVSSKVMNFYRNLWDATFLSNKYENAVTMDLWMARLYGYKTDTFGPAQYRFASYVTQQITDAYNKKHGTNYIPRHIQAALWVYSRNREKYGSNIGAEIKTSDRAAFDLYIERAKQHVVVEAVPSVTSQLFPEIHKQSAALREAYTRDAMQLLLDEDGQNGLFRRLNLPLYETKPGSGSFEGAVNPNEIMSVVMKKHKGGSYDVTTADVIARTLQYIYTQDAVPWFQLDPTLTGGNRGVAISFAQEPTYETQQAMLKHLQKYVKAADFTRVGEHLLVVNYTNLSNKKFIAAVEAAVDDYTGPQADQLTEISNDVKSTGNYLAIQDLTQIPRPAVRWTDEAYAKERLEDFIRRAGSPDLLQWASGRREAVGRLNGEYRDRINGVKYPKIEEDTGAGIEFVAPADPRPTLNNFRIKTRLAVTRTLPTGVETVTTPEEAAHVFAPYRKHPQENFLMLALDNKNRPITVIRGSLGVKDGASIDASALAGALMTIKGIKSYYISHNHPSGIPTPSGADFNITRVIQKLTQGTGINFKGHIVLGEGRLANFFMNPGQKYMGDVWRTGDAIPINIEPRPRKYTLPVSERTIQKRLRAEMEVTDPHSARMAVKDIKDPGVLLLDNRHQVLGYLTIPQDEMAKLKKGGGKSQLRRIVQTLSETNAAAAIIKTDDLSRGGNLANMLTNANVRVLDMMYGQAYGPMQSAAEQGIGLGTREAEFYQGPVDREVLDVKIPPLDKFIRGYSLTETDPLETSVIEVLKNPTQNEVDRFNIRQRKKRQLKDRTVTLRFYIDDVGDTYVWDSNEAIHAQVWEGLENKGIRVPSTADMIMEGSDSIITPAEYIETLEFLLESERMYAEEVGETPRQIKALEKLYQGPRGSIRFVGQDALIRLTESQDLSTFLHESGHFFLEAMREFAQESPEVAQDLDILNTWFRELNPEWDGVIGTEQHEQFARGFERYLMEGKAPTVELQSMFDRFRAWLLEVYKSVQNLGITLTDDVRGVMDRMLAAEEAVEDQLAREQYKAIFESQEAAGMTDAEWQQYQNLDFRRRAEAFAELQHRSVKDMKWLSNAVGKELKRIQAENADKRRVIRAEVSKEVYQEPLYAARRFLSHGELTIEPRNKEQRRLLQAFAMKKHKLDLDLLRDLQGTDPAAPWRYLPKGKYGLVAKEGLDPDEVASLFGLKSGDALVRELVAAMPPENRIDALTDQRMLETYGDITNPQEMDRAAQEAVANAAHVRFVATELRQLNKAVGGRAVLARAAKAFAETAIGRKRVRDIKVGPFRAAQTRAATNSEKALAKGKRDEAADHKRAQLLNVHFERAARSALEEIDKTVRYVNKFNREGTRQNLDPDYLDQIDALLERFDFRKSVSLKEIERRKSLVKWYEETQANEYEEPIIDEFLLNEARRQHYKDLTLEELRGLRDSIKNIEHLGRLKQKLLTAKDNRNFAERVAEAKASMEKFHNRVVKIKPKATDKLGQAGEMWTGYLAELRKMASILREMDGGHDGGVMWTLLGMPAMEAANRETQLNLEITEKLFELFSQIKLRALPNNIKAKSFAIPGTDLSMTDEKRLSIALNWGTESSRQRVMDGGVIEGRPTTPEEIRAIFDTFTKAEWDFVQGMLDYVGSYKEQIAAQEKRLTGREPEWLPAAPIVTKFGTYPGGYFPAKYDARLSTRSAMYEALADQRQGMKGAFQMAATRHSYTKKRADEVKGRPLRQDFSVIVSHLGEVSHRLAYEDWVKDAKRILLALDEDIRKYYGPDILNQLQAAIEDVATGDAVAKNTAERILNHFRLGSTIVGLGYRATTALIQVAGLAQTFVRVGPKWSGVGIAEFARNPVQAANMVNEMSPMMRQRGQTFMREVNEALGTIKTGKVSQAWKASFFWAIGKLQKFVDIPTWLGAYRKAQAQLGLSNAVTEEDRQAIEHKARLMADQAVKDAQSHGQIIDLAQIQRGGAYKKIWTVFYSYFSATYNLNVEAYRKTHFKNPIEVGEFIASFITLNILPVVFSVAMYEALRPECDGDPECIGRRFAAEQIRYLMGMFVYIREMQAVGNLVSDEPVWDYRGPAGIGIFDAAVQSAKQVGQFENDAALWKSVNKLAGTAFHYPAGQINNTMEGIFAIEQGEVEGFGILQALLAGPPR